MEQKYSIQNFIKFEYIDQYCNIKKSLEEITSNYFFRDYYLDDDEFKSIANKQNIRLLKDFNEEENKLLDEILKSQRHIEYDIKINRDIPMYSRKKVMSYIYWLCKLIDTSININLNELKRIVQIKSVDKYIVPIKINTPCKICGEESTIYVNNYNKKDISFKCTKCNHEETINKEQLFPIECKCEKCNKLNQNFFETIKSNFKGLINGIRKQVEDFYNQYEYESFLISDEEMEVDYKINRCELDKDVREIMSYNPKNKTQLLDIMDKLRKRKGFEYMQKLYDKLKELNIIYAVYEKNDLEVVQNEFIDRFIRGNNNIKNEKNLDIIQKFLNNCENIQSFKCAVRCYNYDRVCFSIDDNDYELFLNTKMAGSISDKLMLKLQIKINKFYFENSSMKSIAIGDKRYINKIFKSPNEESLYVDIRNKYPKFIVIPNCKASTIINTNEVKKILTDEQYRYLIVCEFDFVICDLEGYPFKVIELQRGSHHNKEEWIIKDKIKAHICQVVGIDFEEMF